MSFGWLGTFRQGSWQAFRRFVLEERRDIAERIRVIEAELTRIGDVSVLYASTTDADGNTEITEERQGFTVPVNSSLGKLFRAYIALGGNPFDVSLFLTPDAIVVTDPESEDQESAPTQPYGGVVYPKSASYSSGILYEGGYMTIKKYVPARTGGPRRLEDYSVANLVKKARKWTNQEIRFKRNDIEARIIKLCDLREQLQLELQEISWMAAGISAANPYLNEDLFDPDLTIAGIVATIDAIFYVTDEDNTADFDAENEEALGYHPYLMSDISPDEDNTAL
jgi:hypothetical protein